MRPHTWLRARNRLLGPFLASWAGNFAAFGLLGPFPRQFLVPNRVVSRQMLCPSEGLDEACPSKFAQLLVLAGSCAGERSPAAYAP